MRVQSHWTALRRHTPLAVAVLLAGIVLALHLEFYRHAGPLWRDEVGTVNYAHWPASKIVDMRLGHTHPVLWPLLLHAWVGAGLGDTDAGVRRLGLAVGIAAVGVLWWSARRLYVGAPLVTLLLAGMSPSVIVYGDAVRGYGLALLAIVWCMAALWAFVERPNWRTYAVAQLSALLAGQTYYGNFVPLAALCLGAGAVCVRRRAWLRLAGSSAIGLTVLLLTVVERTAGRPGLGFGVYETEHGDWGLGHYLGVLSATLSADIPLLGAVWVLAAALAVAGCVASWWRPSRTGTDLALYVGVAVPVAVIGWLVAALASKLPTQAWHYVPLVGVLALGCDVGIGLLARRIRDGRMIRVASVTVLAALVGGDVLAGVRMRMTNVDVAAALLEPAARPEDLIVVFPWQCGLTFNRYYRGSTPWITVPDVSDRKYEALLLVVEKLKLGDAGFAEELARVRQVLRGGGRVWVVGGLMVPPPGEPPPSLPPAPTGPWGWRSAPYVNGWLLQLGAALRSHAAAFEEIALPQLGRVNPLETVPPILVFDGWREQPDHGDS